MTCCNFLVGLSWQAMIIACPACATRYVVPDSSIGVEGRTVRCAKCRHSWFQDGPVPEGPPQDPATAARPQAKAAAEPHPPQEPIRTPTPSEGMEGEEHSAGADVRPMADKAPEVDAPDGVFAPAPPPPPPPPPMAGPEDAREDQRDGPPVATGPSQFDHSPPFRARRNPAKVWTVAAIVFATLALGTIGAVSYWGLPAWVPVSRPTFGPAQSDLMLEFPRERQDRRTLANGTEFFGATGTVTNIGRETRSVPSILIQMRDGQERIVYSWEVEPPKRTLSPGESITINEAVTDVPRSARFAEIGWKPD